MSATMSPCGTYRYELRRHCDGDGGPICWVMLNPSTADAEQDDPTIRRCRSFSTRWGFGALIVVNLFAYRAVDPARMKAAPDPVGPLNDAAVLGAACDADQVVCAWGNHGNYRGRGAIVTQLLRETGLSLWCLAVNANSQPKHPLYVKADQMLRPYPVLR